MKNEFGVPHNVFEDAKFKVLSPSACKLYTYLCKIKNRMGKERFFRSIETLAADTGLHPNTIKRAKKELIKSEYIGVERNAFLQSGHRAADVFHLNGYMSKSDR